MKRQALRKWSWLFVALLLAFLVCVPALPAQAQSAAGLEVKFAGVIQAVPAAPGYPVGVWRVAGREITVNTGTRIQPRGVVAAVGMWADVSARRGADGALTAQQVMVMPAEVRIKGPIGAKPADPKGLGDWTIAGLKITVNADTRISQQRRARSTWAIGPRSLPRRPARGWLRSACAASNARKMWTSSGPSSRSATRSGCSAASP